MPCEIHNPNLTAMPLPYPGKGVIGGGASVIVDLTVSQVETALGVQPATGGFKFIDRTGYSGPFDSFYAGFMAGSGGASGGDYTVDDDLIVTDDTSLGGDVAFDKEANHAIAVSASTGSGVAGGNLSLAAGSAGAGNANGGAASLDAGAKAGSGTDGAITIGGTNAESVAIGRTGKTVTVPGALAVTQGSTLTGAVGVGGAADASAALTVTSTTKGLLLPRMTTTQRDAISSPTEGLVIYNTTTHKINVRVAAAWEAVTSA